MGRSGDYEFGKELGRGSFGVVHRVRRSKDGRSFVCKQIQLQSMTKKAREEANMEVTILRRVSSGSAYITQYIDSFLEGDALHIIMEFCEHGDLSDYLKRRGGNLVPERTVWKFLIEIGLGLQWLHHSRILHRDIKTLNVFLTSVDDVRLGDLGVARVLSHNTQFANTFVGTPYYLSPELCEEKPYNEKSDVWAYGCVIYEICCLRHPFDAKNHAALLVKILRGQYAAIHDTFSDELRNVVDDCMRRDYSKRPTLTYLLSSAVVRSKAQEFGIETPALPVNPAVQKAIPASQDDDDEVLSPVSGARQPAARAPAQQPHPPACGRPPVAAPPRVGGQPGPTNGRIGLPPGRRSTPDRAVRGRAKSGAANIGSGKTQVISAPPSALAAAQQAARNPPKGPVAQQAAQQVGAAYNRQPTGGEGPGPPIRRPPPGGGAAGSAEERRRAAREVADLPDRPAVVVSRYGRNAPSVHQLMRMEAGGGSSSGGSDHEGADATLRPATFREAETTLSPGDFLRDAEATLLLPLDEDAASAKYGRPPLPQVDREPQLRLLRHVQSSSGGAELTCQSAFGTSSMQDSLMYTADDSLQSTAHAEEQGDFAEGDSDGAAESGFGSDVVISWHLTGDGNEAAVEDAGFDDEASQQDESDVEDVAGDTLAMTASLNMDGLLCDVLMSVTSPSSAAFDDEEAEAEDLVEEELTRRELEEEEVQDEVQAVIHAAEQATDPSRPPPKCPPDPRKALQKRIRSLSQQIQRQYARVVEGLDAPARVVWDELYRLFQAKSKLSVDLTDEDQGEIERYVFESLPTESTDLMWEVYKVLHLEQERDQCEKKLLRLDQTQGELGNSDFM